MAYRRRPIWVIIFLALMGALFIFSSGSINGADLCPLEKDYSHVFGDISYPGTLFYAGCNYVTFFRLQFTECEPTKCSSSKCCNLYHDNWTAFYECACLEGYAEGLYGKTYLGVQCIWNSDGGVCSSSDSTGNINFCSPRCGSVFNKMLYGDSTGCCGESLYHTATQGCCIVGGPPGLGGVPTIYELNQKTCCKSRRSTLIGISQECCASSQASIGVSAGSSCCKTDNSLDVFSIPDNERYKCCTDWRGWAWVEKDSEYCGDNEKIFDQLQIDPMANKIVQEFDCPTCGGGPPSAAFSCWKNH